MELDILQKAKELEKELKHLKWSKQKLHDFCILKKDVSLHMYINVNGIPDALVLYAPFGVKVVDFINGLFDEVIKEKENQLKEL